MSDPADILFERRGRVGLVTLNRPSALNALTLDMIQRLAEQLETWRTTREIGAVVIRGAGERAFCAGGDVRDLYEKRGTDFGATYYAAEYRLNVAIHRYPKPYVALMDGLVMGGGAGVSVHGSHRIATERTTFAMPETAIGLFPDVGAGWFLNRCPGEIGLYLALTGYRMGAADTVYARIADSVVASASLDRLVEDLARLEAPDAAAIDSSLLRHRADPGAPPLAARRAEIDCCFGAGSVTGILRRLDEIGGDWAADQIQAIGRMSPTSLAVSFRQLRQARAMERIEDVMQLEFRLAHRFYSGHDFFEGTRALIIDKDGAPKWNPARLDDVSDEAVDAWFGPIEGEPAMDKSA